MHNGRRAEDKSVKQFRSLLPEWAYVAAFILLLIAVGLQRWKIYTLFNEVEQVKADFVQYMVAVKNPSAEGREQQVALEEMYFRNARDKTILIEGRKLCK